MPEPFFFSSINFAIFSFRVPILQDFLVFLIFYFAFKNTRGRLGQFVGGVLDNTKREAVPYLFLVYTLFFEHFVIFCCKPISFFRAMLHVKICNGSCFDIR